MKEYLLLRNNKQSGPYSLEELKGMGLKPFDLIWHQKKSASWKYPSEIDELGALVADSLTTTSAQNVEAGVYNTEKVSSFASVSNKSEAQAESTTVAEDETPVRYIRHVVALKPTIDHTQVKTIKSTNQPAIVKVEVRDNETIIERTERKESDTQVYERSNNMASAGYNNNTVAPDETIVVNDLFMHNAPAKALYVEPDNKLEWMMLIIGATSLIAIVYLLITSPY
ncbi:MAG: hypothetical protein QM802_05730 [Agriterribacter sp.]